MNAFGLVFHNPAAWAGLAALGLPLLIHLMTRRTPRRLVFPTIRFLHRAQANMTSLYRVRHLLMLLVRTLAILAILGAFLRPALHRGPLATGDPKALHRVAMIILDGSLSMAYSRGGGGPWVRARQATQKIIDSLGANDRCNLILAAGQPHATFDEPSGNYFQLRRDVQELQPTLERANLDAAIGEALRQLEPIKGMRQEIYFISDFQRSNWDSVGVARIHESIVTLFVPVAESNPRNLAITEVQATPGNPVVDEPVAVACKVANYGPEPSRVALQLSLGEETPLERDLEIKPGMTALATFRFRARKTGIHEATVHVPPDDLGADDARHFVLPVADRVEALVLTDESPNDSSASHRFLCRALDPYAVPSPSTTKAMNDDGRAGGIHCIVRAPDAITRFDLDRAHLVLICGVREMSNATTQLLLDYLARGGGIIQFIENPADKTNLLAMATLSKNEFTLPVDLAGPVERRTPAVLVGINYDEPMLHTFRGVTELGETHFSRFYSTPPRPGEGDVILRYDDGNVAVARKQCRLGSLLLCNFTPSHDGGDLAKRTLFVPLMHEFCQAMRPHGGVWRSFQVGNDCEAAVAIKASEPLPVLYSPAGQSLDAVVEAGTSEAMMIYPRTQERGFYRVRAGEHVLASIPVNVDPRESNLEALSSAEIDMLGKSTGALSRQSVIARTGAPFAMERLVQGRMIWHWVLLAGLLLLAVEQMLTLVWRR